MRAVTQPEHQRWAGQLKEWMSLYAQAEDLINIGAYSKGANPKLDQAISVIDRIQGFLRQSVEENSTFSETVEQLHSINLAAEAFLASQGQAGAVRR